MSPRSRARRELMHYVLKGCLGVGRGAMSVVLPGTAVSACAGCRGSDALFVSAHDINAH